MKTLSIIILATACLGVLPSASARDLYVDNVRGLETNDGLAAASGPNNRGPFQTIHRGLRTAQPGDVVHLAKNDEPYHESAVFHNRECPADKPITLDGHDAIISGAERVDLADWELVEPGLYRKTKLLKHCDSAVVGRYFFRFNGAMQHMGRTSKGPSAKLKDPKDLQPGEWTFTAKGDGTPKSPYVDDTFYVKIDPAKRPSDYVIEYPARSSGVQVSGRNENIVIRNLSIEHVYNDGFNIHGYSRGVLFENVAATECGDDGISAHDDCRITVRGFRSIGNSTGFCHTNESWSDSENVFIAKCLGFDVFVLGSGTHRLADSEVLSSASSSVVVMGPNANEPTGRCTLVLDRVDVVREGKNEQIRFGAGSTIEITDSTIGGFHIQATGSDITLRDSVVCGRDVPNDAPRVVVLDAATKYQGASNRFDLKHFRRGDKTVTRETFEREAAALGEANSLWTETPLKNRRRHAKPSSANRAAGE